VRSHFLHTHCVGSDVIIFTMFILYICLSVYYCYCHMKTICKVYILPSTITIILIFDVTRSMIYSIRLPAVGLKIVLNILFDPVVNNLFGSLINLIIYFKQPQNQEKLRMYEKMDRRPLLIKQCSATVLLRSKRKCCALPFN
jgi:hypothetical protein